MENFSPTKIQSTSERKIFSEAAALGEALNRRV
jgi:hypothetical protein